MSAPLLSQSSRPTRPKALFHHSVARVLAQQTSAALPSTGTPHLSKHKTRGARLSQGTTTSSAEHSTREHQQHYIIVAIIVGCSLLKKVTREKACLADHRPASPTGQSADSMASCVVPITFSKRPNNSCVGRRTGNSRPVARRSLADESLAEASCWLPDCFYWCISSTDSDYNYILTGSDGNDGRRQRSNFAAMAFVPRTLLSLLSLNRGTTSAAKQFTGHQRRLALPCDHVPTPQ